jgi:hypothetical protein
MPGDLAVALQLTAQDLMSPELLKALATIREVQAATAELNGTGGGAVAGTAGAAGLEAEATAARELAAAEREVAAAAHEASAALKEEGGALGALHEEYVGGVTEMFAGLIAFEAVRENIDKVAEAAREAEVANRQLTARFGEGAAEYREFAEQIAAGTNFTAVSFERAASALAPLRRDYGLTDEQLRELLKTTADLAAANAIPLTQAANDVAASMRGQARAGVELGLNMRANVIAGMEGLTEAEKRAAAGGDSVAGAQARLHVIMLESEGALGAAAAAAGETGDQFARMDKATANLYETLAKAPVIQSLANDLATAATSGSNLILVIERLNELDAEAQARGEGGTNEGNFARGFAEGAYPALAAYRLAAAEVERQRHDYAARNATTTGMAISVAMADANARTDAWDARSAGVPPQDWRTSDEKVWEATTTAVRSLTAAEGELAMHTSEYREGLKQTALDGGDLFTRHTQGWIDIGSAITAAAQEMGRFDLQLQTIGKDRGVASGLLGDLQAARSLQYRMGTYHGEYDADILELRRRQQRLTLAGGAAADARVRAGLSAEAQGGDFYDVLKVDTQHVTAQVVYVNGSQGSIGQMSDISGGGGTAPVSDMISRRYENARSAGPWASTRGGGGL